jgi:APA family basic amino acid/polyamine antiporter
MKCLYGLLEAARRLQMTSAAVDRPRQATVTTLAGTAIVIADMVGVGVFTSLGFQVKDVASNFAILFLWFIGGLVALCGAFCYAELSAMFPRSSGEYNFLTRAYSPGTGFLAGWLSATVGFSAPVALAAMAFGDYFRSIVPSAPPLISGLAAIWLISSFHLVGIRQGSALQIASTLLKLALIVAFIIAGLATGGGQSVSFMPKAGDSALIFSAPFAMSLVFVMYAYSGWNAATYIVSEIKDPQRSLPKALFLGTGTVILLYLALNAVFLYTTPVAALAGQLNVAQVVGTHIFGQSGGRIVGALICLGLISTISAMMWIGPRVTMTMGEDLPMLRLFARRSANGVPAVAISFQLVVASLLLCTGSFEAVLDFIQFSLTFCSFLTVLGMVKLRFTRPDFPRPYRAWGYPLTPIVFLGTTALIMYYLITARPLQSFLGFLMMCVGLLLYGLGNLQQAGARRAPAE